MKCFYKLKELLCEDHRKDIYTISIIEAPIGDLAYLGKMMVLVDDIIVENEIEDISLKEKILNEVKRKKYDKPLIIELNHQGQFKLFWNKIITTPRALICGAGHISQPLVEILSLINYEVTVIDDRPDFANNARFPKAKNVICQGFKEGLRAIKKNSFDVIIIVTRGHKHDLVCLNEIITSQATYIGMIGSQRRVKAIIKDLKEEGFDENILTKLRAPIGLDIGSQTPEEIAVAIVAEVIAVTRKCNNYIPLSTKRS